VAKRRFLGFPQLGPEKGIRWRRPHIDRLEKKGLFPKRIHLGPMTVAWDEAELDAFLAAKLAERDKENAAAGSTEVELLTAA
jgi:predicted DNA-binding transcriptional regulator AlpA